MEELVEHYKRHRSLQWARRKITSCPTFVLIVLISSDCYTTLTGHVAGDWESAGPIALAWKVLFLTIWELTIIHEYFCYNSAHTYILHMQCISREEFFILGLLSYCFLCCFSLSFRQWRFCILKWIIWFKIFIWKNSFIAVSLFPCKDILFSHSSSSHKIISIWHMIKDILVKC